MDILNSTHINTETKYVDTGRIRFAYRRFGNSKGIPLVFFQHFTGNMDNWDPAITDGLAKSQEIILFDNAGAGNTNGETPSDVRSMTKDALTFMDAMEISKANLLGFSLGGFIAQQIAIERPNLVNKMILAGTGPEGSEGFETLPEKISTASQKEPVERMLYLFFEKSEASRQAGISFLQRLMWRKDRDKDTSAKLAEPQLTAIMNWGAHKNNYEQLKKITQPVLVVNGSNDIFVPTKNSYTLYEQLPNAYLSLYPDSGHGALFQYHELFVKEADYFLNN